MAALNPPSVADLLLFHRHEREFFNRLIHRLGQRHVPTQWVMSLWLWFESIGHHDFIRRVSSSSDQLVLHFLAEAKACLLRLIFNSSSDQQDDEHEPLLLTNTLVSEPIGLRFFDYHHQEALHGVLYFQKNVSEIIFNDNITDQIAAHQVLSSGLHINWRPSVQYNVREDHFASSSALMLNSMAGTSSAPVTDRSPEEQRSMFITFSRGYPLTRDEIKDFFNMRFGRPCVEMVMIEKAPVGVPPMYGRVVFTTASVIAVLLNGQKTAKFMIKGRHLWARVYVPRHSSN
ncbi:uncharacterized protein LOC110031063 [Phalaenopsis equestris]|uniref:uncharacterized protein LOC110031063 n=1 Tax=Phalaenopsis equestris TaxID=78828 RepID=UPI0009E54490|nr:uncharacterized protein LOC110031063 [Phalaenopsis equestris]